MILWFTGNTGAGKTTLAKEWQKAWSKSAVLLDGDELRSVWPPLDLSEESRRVHCMRIARLAALLDSQDFNVITAVIAPYEDLRKKIKAETGCHFIYVEGGHPTDEEHPYEIPVEPFAIVRAQA